MEDQMMKKTKMWEEVKIPINELFLDTQNPRIPDKFSAASQKELIQELMTNEDVLSLAKEIVDKKDYPQLEKCIVVNENKKIVVLEGNRRVAAYKCLVNPALAPVEYIEKFAKLAEKVDFDGNKRIEAILVKERTYANPLIEAKHTRPMVKAWVPYQKKLFIKRTQGTDSSALPVKSKSEIAQANLYEMANKLDLPEEVAEIVQDPKRFKLTDLHRVVGSKPGKEFLGYDVDTKGNIVPVNKEEFLKGFKKIVMDVATGEVSSREKARNVDEIKNVYLAGIDEQYRPNLDKKSVSVPASPNTIVTAKPTPQLVKPDDQGQKVPRIPTRQLELSQPLPSITYTTRDYSNPEVLDIIRGVCLRAPAVINQLKRKYKTNCDITIKNEYDFQYLLQGLLKLYFEDVRLEEWTPSGLGGASRMDLFLFEQQIAIELKTTIATGVSVKSLGQDFAKDIAGFKTHPKVKRVFFVAYDPNGLSNIESLRGDIAAQSTRQFPLEFILSR